VDATIVKCQVCGAKNRVDDVQARLKRPTCGKCGAHLPYTPADKGAGPIVATDATWDALLKQAGSKPLLVDFWAEWCGPCKLLAPTIASLAEDAMDRFLVAKLDTDANPKVAGQYQIDSIPALLLFKKGRLAERTLGVLPRDAILEMIERHV
jgi:thioredoxin